MTDIGSDTSPLSMTGEQWVLETRTDDPASPAPDERWIRTDLNEGDRVATLKCGDGTEIPLFPVGLAEETVREARRFQVGGETVFAPLAPVDDAAFPERRFQHDGQLHAFHDRVAPGFAIPDSVVDNFEWGGPVSERYGNGREAGPDDFDINQNSPVFEGNYSLKFTGSVTGGIFSEPGDGLNYYPQAGDLIHGYIRDEDGNGGATFYVACEDNNNGFRIDPNFRDDVFYLSYFDGSVNTIDDASSVGLQSQTWYLLEVEWVENGDDIEIAVRIYDGTDPDDSVLVELSGVDENSAAIGDRGIMFENDKDDSLVVWDDFRALEGGADFD